jgi:mannosyl-oligosaccharide alpha-1,2-mannosidase
MGSNHYLFHPFLLLFEYIFASFFPHCQPSFSNGIITLGAMGDSFYEYLLKMWLQSSPTPDPSSQYRRMYQESMRGVLRRLYRPPIKEKQPQAGWGHLGDLNSGNYVGKMDHLVQ